MKLSTKHSVLAVALTLILAGLGGVALAQDKEAVLKNRETLMKGQAKDLGSIKAYTEGKADMAQAETSAANLTQSTKKISEVFPPGSAATSSDGKYGTKPAIWSDWNKFLDAQKNAASKADALLVAVKSGDKAAIQTASGVSGKTASAPATE